MYLNILTKARVIKFALALFSLCLTQTSFAQSKLNVRIAASSDDAEENPTGSAGDLTSSDLEFVMDKTNNQTIGMRFINIKLPKGALVSNAYIQFTVDEPTNINPCNLVIKAEETDNSTTFTSALGTISTRSTTAQSVNWNPTTAWNTDGLAGLDQRTPDLKILVQAIVDRTGWVSGNAMSFIVTGSGARVAQSYDRDPAKAPELVIEYYVPVTSQFLIKNSSDDAEENPTGTAGDLTSSDLEMVMDKTSNQTIGVRFTGINLLKGTIIKNAYIQFTVDEPTNINPCNLTIKAEDTDNSLTFTSALGTISTRSTTAQSVSWNPTAAWNTDGLAGLDQRTPDLKTLVQTIVDRAGWVSGNALSFIVTGVGARVAQSYDRDPAKAAKLVVEYMGLDNAIKPKAEIGSFPINRNSQWKYNDKGENLDAVSWNARRYAADSNWVFGNGKLGYGLSALGTTMGFGNDAGNKFPTTYLRRTFISNNISQYDSLIAYTLADDGIVMYINGVEVLRRNVALPGSYSSLATVDISGTDEMKYIRNVIPNLLLNNDTNTVAIEIHQSSVSSSDLVFDMQLIGKNKYPITSNFPISKGSNWLYNDMGIDLGSNWTKKVYEDRNWSNGSGPLGYTDPVTTIIAFGDDNNNKYPTNYFRKKFSIVNLSAIGDSLMLRIMKDDGAVIYINGTEVKRTNMPTGLITYTTLALASANEGIYETYHLSKNFLVQGENIIAVEVHQNDVTSSDCVFDLELNIKPDATAAAKGCAGASDAHIGCFTSVAPSTKGQLLVLPKTHDMQLLVQTGTPYTIGSGNVSTNFDFTGFIPDNMTSSIKGHVALNYETTPGGVAMFDVSFNPSTQLWSIDSSRAISFAEVGGTQRNCSGGITPWGTIVTAEESRGSVDANSDGYFDMGWLVEIDPKTNKIPQYGSGKAQKLWAMGNASHENVVVASDSITAYWGEDAGDGSVFKYVADKKGDLSSGKLYALNLGSQLQSNEPQSKTGVWTLVPNTTVSDRNTSYSLAKSLGSTIFNGVEDVEISPLDKKIYFTAKGNSRTYRFMDNGSTISDFETFVGGTNYSVLTDNSTIVTEPWGTGNDNLTFDDRGNLYVLQDGSQDHIWMVRPDHTQDNPKIELFATTPAGSEPTGMTFTPDYKYMFISMQNPSSANTATIIDASGKTVTFNTSSMLVIARKENLGNKTVSIEEENLMLNNASVYPNPTEDELNVKFDLKLSSLVKVDILDVLGKIISTPINNVYNSGQHVVKFNIENSGVYFVKVSTSTGINTYKVIVK